VAGRRLLDIARTDKVMQSNRERLMQQELERYMKHTIGGRPNTGRVYASTMHNR
jgi:hypothetical protein